MPAVMGLEEVLKGFREMPFVMQRRIAISANNAVARELTKDIANASPIRTGNLRSETRRARIRKKSGRAFREGYTHYVGTGLAFYALFLEQGTLNITARRFTSMAIDQFAGGRGLMVYQKAFTTAFNRNQRRIEKQFQKSP